MANRARTHDDLARHLHRMQPPVAVVHLIDSKNAPSRASLVGGRLIPLIDGKISLATGAPCRHAIVEKATRLCGASEGSLRTFDTACAVLAWIGPS
jgi:hypothetical protein